MEGSPLEDVKPNVVDEVEGGLVVAGGVGLEDEVVPDPRLDRVEEELVVGSGFAGVDEEKLVLGSGAGVDDEIDDDALLVDDVELERGREVVTAVDEKELVVLITVVVK